MAHEPDQALNIAAEQVEEDGAGQVDTPPITAEAVRSRFAWGLDGTFIDTIPAELNAILGEYVTFVLYGWSEFGFKRESLAEAAFADFDGWETRHFSRVPTNGRRLLRNTLMAGGVHVEQRLGLHIAVALGDLFGNPGGVRYLDQSADAPNVSEHGARESPLPREAPPRPVESENPVDVPPERHESRLEPDLGSATPSLVGVTVQLRDALESLPDQIAAAISSKVGESHIGRENYDASSRAGAVDPTVQATGESRGGQNLRQSESMHLVREPEDDRHSGFLKSYERLSDVGKNIDHKMRYHGKPDENLSQKILHFQTACKLAQVVSDEGQLTALPLVLAGEAERVYRREIQNEARTLDEAVAMLKSTFLSDEARRANDTIWDQLSFIQKRGMSVTNREALDSLLEDVDRIRDNTSAAMLVTSPGATDALVRARLLSAVSGVDAFRHVRSNPPASLHQLQGALYDAAIQADTVGNTGMGGQSLLTERRFREYNPNPAKGKRVVGTGGEKHRYRGDRICYVCLKQDCHSSKHSESERKEARLRARAYLSVEDERDGDEDEGEAREEAAEDPIEETSGAESMFTESSTVMATSLICGEHIGSASRFFGIVIDTGCNTKCTSSDEQYHAYCAFVGVMPKIHASNEKFNTSGGSAACLGFAEVVIPFSPITKVAHLRVFIFGPPSKAPMLLSYRDMLRLGISTISMDGKFIENGQTKQRLLYDVVNDTPVYRWNPTKNRDLRDASVGAFYTEDQLRRVHRRLGHPSLQKVDAMFRRSDRFPPLTPEARKALVRIGRSCRSCQMMSRPPQRFRFSVQHEIFFNHEVMVDVMHLVDGDVLHCICVGTRFQSGRFLREQTSKAVWDALRLAWIDVLAGPPDILKTDAGTNFTSREFLALAANEGIVVEAAPTEAHNRIGMIERYHKVVREVYEKLRLEDPSVTREARLSLTFRCVNDSVGPDGLIPTLLVFGMFPKLGLPNEKFAPNVGKRADTVARMTALATQLHTERRLRDAMTRGPAPNHTVMEEVRSQSKGSPILVYREDRGWTGPHRLVAVNENVVWYDNVQTGKQSTIALEVVKPFIGSEHVVPAESSHYAATDDPAFAAARQAELAGLLARKVFHPVPRKLSRGHRVYRGMWVERMKESGAKSRLVVCATNDYLDILTYSPTIQRASMRLAFAVAACRTDFRVASRDVSQAFVQSEEPLRRTVFLEPPQEMNLKPDEILLVDKHLYGLPESPLNWYVTYKNHLEKSLAMSSLPQDPCFLYNLNEQGSRLEGILVLQVDDSLTLGTSAFHRKEEDASKKFRNHGAVPIGREPQKYNGMSLAHQNGEYVLSQEEYIARLAEIPENLDTAHGFSALRSQNALAAFSAYTTRPDLLSHTAYFSQVTRDRYSDEVRKDFNKFVRTLKTEEDIPLRFVALDEPTLHVAVFVDASFASNTDLSTQLGILVLLRDGKQRSNVIHACSIKAKRRAKSVLTAEVFAMLDGFDYGYVIRDSLSRLLGRHVELHLFTDSRSAYHVTTTIVTTKEKRLLLDLHLLREAYERRELSHITWITGTSNYADDLTKRKGNGRLRHLLKSNHAEVREEGWVDRDPVSTPPNSTDDLDSRDSQRNENAEEDTG